MTKYQHQAVTSPHPERLEQITREVRADLDAELREFNGNRSGPPAGGLRPTMTISRLVNTLQGVSSRRLRQEFPELRRHYWQAKRLWSGSYFAGPWVVHPSPSCATR